MFNINKIGNDYKSAEHNNPSFFSTQKKCLTLLFVVIRMLVGELAMWIFHLVVPRKPENISKQLALVTGGGNGLGRELCLRLAKENCDVAVIDIDYENAVLTATELKEKFGVKSCAFQCDVSNYSAVVELKNKVEKNMKIVDILVLNAGLLFMSDFVTSEFKDMQRVVDVNLTSQFIFARVFLPEMIKQKRGRIVSVSSMTAINPMPSAVVYSSTKFAVDGFMECLHYELSLTDKDEYIKLTTVYPDFMNTRKELSDTLDRINYIFQRLTSERVADEAINGMLINRRKVIVSDIKYLYYMMKFYPYRIRKTVLKAVSDIKSLLK